MTEEATIEDLKIGQRLARQVLRVASEHHAKEPAAKIVKRYEAIVRGSFLSDGEAVAEIEDYRAEQERERDNRNLGPEPGWQERLAERRRREAREGKAEDQARAESRYYRGLPDVRRNVPGFEDLARRR